MSKKIDHALIKKVGRLARLELDETEIKEFTGQLETILEYVEIINKIDTSEVEPLAHCLPVNNRFREDRMNKSFDPDTALLNAPAEDNGYFKVPPILE